MRRRDGKREKQGEIKIVKGGEREGDTKEERPGRRESNKREKK